MRLLLLAALLLLPGCFALDELDNANDTLDAYAGERAPDPEPEAEEDDGPGLGERLSSLWDQRPRLDSGGGDPAAAGEIVRCDVDGKLSFVRKPDCLARGGHVLR